MNDLGHAELRELLGSYALGQLGADERAVVDAHLEGCAGCRAELAALVPVVEALRQLDPTQLGQPEPPAALGDTVLADVGRRRRVAARRSRARRVAGSLLVAASVAVAFGVGTWWAGPRTDPPVIDVAMRLDAPGLSVDAGLVRHTWGTELKLQAAGLTVGESYAVTFVRDDGERVSAGSFIGTGERPLVCSVNAALPVDEARQVLVTDTRGATVMDADI